MRAMLGAFAVLCCLLAGEQGSGRAADGDTLEQVTMNVSVNGVGGDLVTSDDGVIQSYPKGGGIMRLTLDGLLNGHQVSVPLTGNLIKYVHSVSLFRTGIGLVFEYYIDATGGFVAPCFVDDRTYTARPTGNQSSDAFLKAWAGQQFAEVRQKIQTAGDQVRKGDTDAMTYLSLIVHPDAQRELLNLQDGSDPKVAAAAKNALAISNELRSVVGSN
jgi:hypothetical protein